MNFIKRYNSMYKLFAIPLLLCIGGLFIAATNTNDNETKETSLNPLTEYDLFCMDVELKTQAVRCYGFCDGVLEVKVTGGQEPYTYQWSNGLTTNFSSTLPAGEFSVTVTDAGGCEVVATANVSSPAEIKPNLEVSGSCDSNIPIIASVSPVGGVGNYDIEWSTGETGRSISNLELGQTYSVTITTRGNGCSVTEDFTLTEGLTVDIEKADITCGNQNTGSATVNALSGQAPYTFQWSTGLSETSNSNSTIDNLAADNYTVTVTDASGCESIEEIKINDGGGLNLDLDSAPSTCEGDGDGMANVMPFGGTAPYRYEWSDGQITGSAINLTAGTYNVTVTDIAGCEQVGTVIVESSSNLEITATTNTSNGNVTVMASGGVEPYTYLWSNGETTANSSVYEAGDEYSVTVTDALGCQKTVTNKFPPISGELTININPIAPTCPMYTNGGLETTVTGGVAPYTYEWSTGQTTPDISGLEEGTYGVTVTDADGATASSNITLTSPDPITINIEPTSGDICDGSSTDYEANVSGGTAPYTYAWSNGNTSSILANVESGDYFLTVTDASNCEKIAYLKVRPPFDVKVIGQAVRCADFCDGSVRAMVTGGKAPFTYVWSNGQTGQILEALPVGFYTVTVTDDNGCEAIATGEVTAPPAIEANLRIDGTCEGGSDITAMITPTGGIGDYTILWSTGDTGMSISNLERGQTYTVKITDENGCSITENFTIPMSIGLVLQGESIDIACGDTRGGSATVTVLSGTAPYTYDWIGFPDVTTEESSNTIDNLAQGTYRVTVTDVNQCRGIKTFVIEKKQTLILETGSTPSTCEDSSDGMANVVPTGGIAPYTYLWSDGQTTGTAINVTPGEYTVTVTDSGGCQGIVTVTVEAGTGFEVEASIDEISGTITVTPDGGTAPYTYAWDNGETNQTAINYQGGDTYSVTVTDANGCSTTVTGELPTVDFGIRITSNSPTCHNFSDGSITANGIGGTAPYAYVWSTGQTGAMITGLTAGEYGVTVTDAEGETTSTTVTLINPDPIVVNIEPSSGDVCDGTNTDYEANVTGGTMPYTYKWSDGSTSSTLSTSIAGDYFLTVTDANGCEKIEFLKVSPPLEVEVIGQAVRCDDFCDGSVRAKITGGTGPFTFVWSNGETTQILENLPVGSYTVTVTDANGCEVVATGEVTAPPPIDINLRVDGTCEENSEKTASVNPEGGVGNYSIKWSTGATGNSIGDLQSGQTYSVTVTDGNGCNETETFTIPEDPALVLNIEKTDIACGNTTGGSATVNVFSGDAPYTYTWSNGFSETTDATTSTIEDLEAGTYTVTVTDANGCEGTITITILENDGLILELTSSNACCEDTSDGMANVEVFGGTAPYIYEWSNGQTVGTATGLAPGEYMVTVTDAEGCEGTGSVTVNPSLIIDLSVSVDTINNTVTVNPSGSEGEYTYLWSNGETTQTATGYQSCEEYSVTVTLTVTDAEGNEKNCDETISGKLPCDPDEPLTAIVETMATCEGEASGMATLTISGGVPPYIIDWGDGPTNELTNTNLAAGTYTVTVTDSEGNSQVIEYTIDAISITAEITIDEANNSVTVTPSGGIEPYTYLWDNGETTATATNYAACAAYSVKITDAKGCMLTIDGRIPGDLIVTVETMPTCEGEATGMATLNIQCGVEPYTIDWRNGTGEITNTGLAAGSYIVTVTDSEGDSEVINYTIDEIIISAEITYDTTTNSVTVTPNGGVEPYTYLWDNGETTATATGYEVCDTYSVTITDAKGCMKTFSGKVPSGKPDVTVETTPTCQGDNTGTATITINGCDGPYTFNWGDGVTDDLTNIGLEGGTYTVTVIDANGNTQEIEYTVDELVVEAEIMPTSPACNSNESGSATATVTEGEAPFTYEWSNGVILTSEETTSTVTNLAVGTYTLTITDSNGCKTIKEFEIRNQDITATTTSTPTSCDSNTGTASVTVNGGTAPYTYEWSNGVTETSEESTSTITDLEEGTYEVTVTDANGCKVTTTVTVERENNLQVEVTKTDACCEDSTDGTATVTVLNGIEPYTYRWSNGVETVTATGLATGDYEVTVTDAEGCEGIGMVTIDPIVTIDLSVEVDTINSTVTVNPSSNREGEYTYEWSNGETTQTATGYVNCDEYSVTVTLTTTDSEGNEKVCTEEISGKLPCDEIKTTPTCEGEATGTAMLTLIGGNPPYTIDWGDGSTDELMNTGLEAGTYIVTVTDADGNTREIEYTIEEIILDINVSVTPKQCGSDVGGGATVEIDGGDAPYTIRWSTGGDEIKIDDLEVGEYTVTVTDANGCTKERMFTVEEESGIEATIETTKTLCAQATGTASVTATMGREPFTYQWSNGSMDQRQSGLAAGEYTVTITDANGCDTTLTTTIEEDNDIVITSSKVDADCQASNGSASIEIEGGNEPYTIEWSTGDNGAMVDGLAAGEIIVTVTDVNGCERTATVTIEEKNDLEVEIDVTINGMNNGDTGSLTAVPNGGSGNYSYEWCTGATTSTIDGLITGAYSVTVTDENGCEQTSVGYINTPPELEIMLNCDGTANVTAIIGGCEELDIDWDNGTSGSETVVGNGEHTVIVTLPNGEMITTTFEIDAPLLEATVNSKVDVACVDDTNGSATATAMGGTAPYTYKWSDEAGTEGESVDNLATGTYTVTVTDANNCETTTTVTIDAEQEIDATVNGATVCEGEEAGPSVTNNNEEQTLTYQWMPADLFEAGTADSANPNFIGTENASVTVLIENEAGCTKEETVEIIFNDRSMPNLDNITYEESCLGLKVDFNGGAEVNGYIWRFGDPNNSNDISDESNPTYTYSEAGTYTVTLIPADGAACQDTAKFEITVEGEEELEFEITGDPMVCGDTTGLYSVDDANLMAKWFNATDLENPLGEFNSIELMPGDYIVEVMNAEGCKGVQNFTVMNTQVNIELDDFYGTCAGDELPIEVVNLNASDILRYEWMPNNPDLIDLSNPSNPVFTLEETTTFTSTITNQFGCSVTREITIEVGEVPEIDSLIADDYTIVLGQSTNLRVIGGDPNYTYTWLDDTSIDNPTREVEPMQTTVYTVEITSPDGCVTIRTVTVEVLDLPCEEPYIFIPNAFTPNGDGNNDVIKVQGPHIEELRLEIYNRWGELVFETDDVDGEWDGTYRGQIAEGRVFGYILMVRCIGGETFEKRGNITLLR